MIEMLIFLLIFRPKLPVQRSIVKVTENIPFTSSSAKPAVSNSQPMSSSSSNNQPASVSNSKPVSQGQLISSVKFGGADTTLPPFLEEDCNSDHELLNLPSGMYICTTMN